MLISSSSRGLLHWAKHTHRGAHNLHQYHIHAALSVSTLAPKSTFKYSPTKVPAPTTRLLQLHRHLSTTRPVLQTFDMSGYRTRKIGAPFTLEHRIYIEDNHGNVVSPFHDIPLYANEQQTVLNMIVEIPRWTNAKMEVSYVHWPIPMASSAIARPDYSASQISKEEPLNPIKQDIKKGKLRYVRNCFPHHGYLWNYGAFPQVG